jgi:ADP-ribose pyrophosphatase
VKASDDSASNPISNGENKERADLSGNSAATNPKLGTRRMYSGRVINVDIDQVRFPNGRVGELEMVRHSGASAVVPFASEPSGEDPQVLLLKQYRYAAESFLYEIPAGRLDPGEKPIDCARRELKEETGCQAATLTFMTTIYTTPGFTDERIHLFMAEGLTMGEAAPEFDELIEVETMALSQALSFIEDGTINDAKTALALLYAAGFKC